MATCVFFSGVVECDRKRRFCRPISIPLTFSTKLFRVRKTRHTTPVAALVVSFFGMKPRNSASRQMPIKPSETPCLFKEHTSLTMTMEVSSKTPCFDKSEEEHLRVEPTLSKVDTESTAMTQQSQDDESSEEVDDMDVTCPKSPTSPVPGNDNLAIDVTSAPALDASVSDDSSSEEETAKAPVAKSTHSKDDDEKDNEDEEDEEEDDAEEDDEDGEEDDDEEDDEDEDEGKKKANAGKNVKPVKNAKANAAVEVVKKLLAVKDAKKEKKIKMPVKGRPAKEVAGKKSKVVSESSGDDSDGSIASSESEMEEDDTIVVEKKKMASKKTDAKIAPKSSTMALMQQSKTQMKVNAKTDKEPKMATKTIASALMGKSRTKPAVARAKKDAKGGASGKMPFVPKTSASPLLPSAPVSGDSKGVQSKNKRSRQENMQDAIANKAKCAKLERDIELLVLSVKSRSAALEKAEKELENSEMDV